MDHLPRHAIESFRKAYKVDFGRDISDAEAEQYAWTVLDVLGVSLDIIVRAKQQNAQFESCQASEDGDRPDHNSAAGDSLN